MIGRIEQRTYTHIALHSRVDTRGSNGAPDRFLSLNRSVFARFQLAQPLSDSPLNATKKSGSQIAIRSV